MTFTPRSCPSNPGLANNTLILVSIFSCFTMGLMGLMGLMGYLVSLSPCLLVSLSPCLLVSLSPSVRFSRSLILSLSFLLLPGEIQGRQSGGRHASFHRITFEFAGDLDFRLITVQIGFDFDHHVGAEH